MFRHARHEGRPLEVLAAHMATQGHRMTESRSSLVREVLRIPHDFTEVDVLRRARQDCIRVSRATVFRTLSIMVEAGLLMQLHENRG
jgi:Fe2+ or Zn2+ uptake regulation protein